MCRCGQRSGAVSEAVARRERWAAQEAQRQAEAGAAWLAANGEAVRENLGGVPATGDKAP